MTLQSSFPTIDTSAFEARKALILREGALPDAPLAMPRQVIEVQRAHASDTTTNVLSRLLSMLSHGYFGQAAGGR